MNYVLLDYPIGGLCPPHLCKINSNSQTWVLSIFTITCMQKITKFVPAPILVGVELNPGPRPSIPLPEKERWRCVFLAEENGLNPTQIARKLKWTRKKLNNSLDIT